MYGVQLKWHAHGAENLFAKSFCLGRRCGHVIRKIEQQQNKFVAAKPGNSVALSHNRAKPCCYELQQPVALVVPLRVVNGLEVVNIHKKQGMQACAALADAMACLTWSTISERLASPVSWS